MPAGASIIGGLNAGSRIGQVNAMRKRDEFDMQQQKLDSYNSIVGNAAKTLEKFRQEMAVKRATAKSLEDQALIDQKWDEVFKSVTTPLSRAGERSLQAGVPVDTPAQLAQLEPYRKLPDLNAQAMMQAQSAGMKKGAEQTAQLDAQNTQQPLAAARYLRDDKTGHTIAVTKSGELVDIGVMSTLPTTQNVNQQSRVERVPTDAEKPEGIGRQVMEDTEQSAGIVAGISKGLSSLFGQFVEGTNPRLDAAQRVKNFNQEIKFALSRNPKYPVAEMKAIQSEMLISPDAWMVDPESEAKKVVMMKHSLEKWNEADMMALPRLTDNKAQEALERIGTRQTMIDLIGDVPSMEEYEGQELDALQSKVLDGTATNEEKKRFIELAQ